MKKIINVLKIIMLLFILTNCENKKTHIEGSYFLVDINEPFSIGFCFNKTFKYYIKLGEELSNDVYRSSIISRGTYKINTNGDIQLRDEITKYDMLIKKENGFYIISKSFSFIKNKKFSNIPSISYDHSYDKINFYYEWNSIRSFTISDKLERINMYLKHRADQKITEGFFYNENSYNKIVFYKSKKYEFYTEDGILWSRGYYYYIDGFMYLYDLDLDFSFKAKVLSANSIFIYSLPPCLTNVTFNK